MSDPVTILGIESSCDDTAAAVLRAGGEPALLSSVVSSQTDLHAAFGGVVPEIAARAHALTPRLTDGVAFPYLMLLVSGGHCQFLRVDGAEDFTRLGGTIDDAPGEAFDKVARLLGLAQPGGPMVERAAKDGDPARFALSRPLLDRPGCDMSFSGLKTAVLRLRDRLVADQGGRRGRGGGEPDPARGLAGGGRPPALHRAAHGALHR